MDYWLFLLVFSAIAIGWWLGRRSAAGSKGDVGALTILPDYYKGLNYLFNDQSDGSLDAFISALEVNSETLETHLTVGNLMRRKGEVESAIRIHQNLLSRPSLQRVHLHKAHLELARDFISAGLLDRAERLLEDLLDEAPELRNVARRHLLEIYQDEKEWQKAIDAAKTLLPRKSLLKTPSSEDKSIQTALSHYCCELAELSFAVNDYQSSRSHLKQALGYDAKCVRASLLQADIEFKTEHFDKTIRILHKIKSQDISLVSETVELLKSTYQRTGDEKGFYSYFIECQKAYPSATVMLALVEDIQARDGDIAAGEFLGVQLKGRPSLRGLSRLVELHIANSHDQAKDNLGLLQLLIQKLLQSKAQYQCHHCGFSGKQMHWHCPGCKEWGQIKPIRGAEGD